MTRKKTGMTGSTATRKEPPQKEASSLKLISGIYHNSIIRYFQRRIEEYKTTWPDMV